ncbi:Cation transporter [Beijerinckiaceae bacterium RH AL1]|nr:cation diffusion facilitator family transporter [Beijerinckiaceae bacterium]VVB49983.1 Cation transporter [Beijerinckiaceae bacterium RH CH11]VVB50063.1 Cation transporter [Beijerinckiaceae bacterium RH AL8]VVC57178.1 Cation transporter [Beijerinckiaceae bacterium RH AL1]
MAGHDHLHHDHGAAGGHHGHSHGHSHGPGGHSHAPTSFGTAFAFAIALNTLIVVAEGVAGLVGHSVALVADATHNLSDVLGLCAAFAAYRLGRRAPSRQFTYGLGGTSILAALFNAVLLLVVTGALMLEAVQRLLNPEPVATGIVMAVAAAAIVGNGLSAWLLAPGKDGDLNVRAAVAHLAADAGVAAGVVVGALAIRLTGLTWIDPLLSLAINAMIIVATWQLLRESVAMSLAGVPRSVEMDDVRAYLAELPGVDGMHDLHVWSVSTSEVALTAHLVMPTGHPGDVFLMDACRVLRERHGIGHATLQIETSLATDCRLAPESVV